MKNLVLILFLTTFLVGISPAAAHPGRTSSDGCHYCRTNCDDWGVAWNARHCHDGYVTPSTPVSPPPTVNKVENNEVSAIPQEAVKTVRSDNITVDVTKIIDGDTFDVEYDGVTERVRILGIDTPETKDPRKPVECFGQEASDKLTELINGKKVVLQIDKNGDSIDVYGRLIRQVKSYSLQVDYGAEMVEHGYAYAYLKYPFTQSTMDKYKELENQARDQGLGLWEPGVCGVANTKNETKDIDGILSDVGETTSPTQEEKGSVEEITNNTSLDNQSNNSSFTSVIAVLVAMILAGVGYTTLRSRGQ